MEGVNCNTWLLNQSPAVTSVMNVWVREQTPPVTSWLCRLPASSYLQPQPGTYIYVHARVHRWKLCRFKVKFYNIQIWLMRAGGSVALTARQWSPEKELEYIRNNIIKWSFFRATWVLILLIFYIRVTGKYQYYRDITNRGVLIVTEPSSIRKRWYLQSWF